jgi:hypothetical protein
MPVYAVEIVTHITRGDSYDAGRVTAATHEDASRLACEQGIVRDFQTFRVREIAQERD